MSPEAPTRVKQTKEGPPIQRVMVEAPAVERLSQAQLAEVASSLAKKPVKPAPKALMELTARHP
jgi:hypothetical protein